LWDRGANALDRVTVRAGDGIRTHDVQLGRLTLYQLSYSRIELAPARDRPEANSGGCWIRTNVGNAGRFTACSLWPLGQPSRERELFSIGADEGTRTPNHLLTKQVLYRLSYASRADLRRAQTGASEGRHSVKTSMGHRGEQNDPAEGEGARKNEGTPPVPLFSCSGDEMGTDENGALVAPGLGAVKHNSYRPQGLGGEVL
jgi:hypothetical protein